MIIEVGPNLGHLIEWALTVAGWFAFAAILRNIKVKYSSR